MRAANEIQKLLTSTSLDDVTHGLQLMETMPISQKSLQDLLGIHTTNASFSQLRSDLSRLPHGFVIAVWAVVNVGADEYTTW